MLISFFICIILVSRYALSVDNDNRKRFKKYSFNRWELQEYRNQVKDLFYFAHDNYLEKAYPYDELRPISCKPKIRNFDDPNDIITNDVLGNFSVTLIDSLTTIAIFNDKEKFRAMVELVERTFPQKFDIDSTVQVFETTIRIIGGLISSHLYATDPSKKVYLGPQYNNCLLELARDMADRLLPAYLTSTGLPVPRINLRHRLQGITAGLISENNVAAMASPMFEFTMLSYLTNDEKYAAVTRYAMNKTWSLRSDIDLLPMSFNPETGQCYSHITGIGASIDSFYEYALKGAILFDDSHLYKIWQDSYEALNTNCRADWLYVNAQPSTGQLSAPWIDSLSAFFPGLQVLAGDVEDAALKNMMSLKLWDTYGGLPERWQFHGPIQLPSMMKLTEEQRQLVEEQKRSTVPLEWYPLRPEFIESTYFLYRATKDPFYLNIGVEILESFKTRFKYNCGFGGIQNVLTGTPQDRMETFVLSETLKYLFLLFDEENEIHRSRDNVIFSTEAHPMWLKSDLIRQYSANKFFKDNLFVQHLKACRDQDAKIAAMRNKGSFMGGKLVDFARSLFADVREEIESNELQPEKREIKDPDVCPSVATGEDLWSYSTILSNFDKLFEIDYRFKATLLKPAHIVNSSEAIEIKPGFYDQWADHKRSKCGIAATTDSFELILEIPGKGNLTRLDNGSISSDTLGGRWKFRIERMQPSQIDVYGELVSTKLFEDASCRNLFKSDLLGNSYSPTLLYRVTALNGMRLPKDGKVILNQRSLLENVDHAKALYELFGYNPHNQLMFDSIPIVNLYLI